MRNVLILALAAIALAGPALAKGHDGDDRHGGYERGHGNDYEHSDDWRFEPRYDQRESRGRRGFDERRRREFDQGQYGYARPPAYYPVPGSGYFPPVYSPPGLNLFVPFR